MKLAREGVPFILGAAVLSALGFGAANQFDLPWLRIVGWVFAVLTLFVAYFFRDPARTIPTNDNHAIAPADGKIVLIMEVDEPTFMGGRAKRVSIFLNVFNVHLQRSPLPARIGHRSYNKGKFMAAWAEKASLENEQASLGLETPRGKVMVTQIAGLIAKRIVTYPVVGDTVTQGQHIGLIRFGSRVDLYLPMSATVSVAIGDHVVGGETVMAHLSGTER